MRVLITQPAQEAAISARALTARGHEPISIPLVTVERETAPQINLTNAQGFLAVSAEGVRALADLVGVRTFPIFVESDLTAAEARRLGFKDIHAAKDDGQDLARLVERTVKPANGALIYACSTAAPVNLPTMLGNMGFAIRALPLYSIKRVETIPPALRARLSDKTIDVALFLSPEEARAFVTLMQRDESAPSVAGLKTVAATPAIAAPMRGLKGASITVAADSDPETVWATLDGELIDKVEEERRTRERAIKEEAERQRAEQARIENEKRVEEARAEEKRRAEEARAV
jgi:uroporphyrinogen-III synthase